MRAVLDPNVIVSGLLSRSGAPAEVLRLWARGLFEVVASALLLSELERVLAYPELRSRLDAHEAARVVELLRLEARLVDDPRSGTDLGSPDPDDDYLLALAIAQSAYLVTGDGHLRGLDPTLPIETPGAFLIRLTEVA